MICNDLTKAHEVFSQGAVVRNAGATGVSQYHPQVEKESDVQEGIALINAMHITAPVFINDDEQGLHADYEAWLERLAPEWFQATPFPDSFCRLPDRLVG